MPVSNTANSRVTAVVIGAGSRGSGYAEFGVEHPDRLQIVAVAEPRQFFRERMRERHAIREDRAYADWRELAAAPRMADAAIIATPDALHTEPAIALAGKGYHLLLEKPMAPTAAECVRIVDAVRNADVMLAVCHVLRYTDYTAKIKQLVDSGAIGSVVSMQHLEPVGFWHFAHSFVRGNWRNEAESSFLLLAKSCHDLDWIRYVMGARCRAVSSFGSLTHFRHENQPTGAGDRCVSCGVESSCPYSALRFYLGRLREGKSGWPVDVVVPEPDEARVLEALREGPYGRCVYACDNDVVDNQTVTLQFEGGRHADFQVVAFSPIDPGRQTQIFGTAGHLSGDSSQIDYYDFLTQQHSEIDTRASDATVSGGHGGGDQRLMQAFVSALHSGDRSLILSGPEETLETHLMTFAAERSRREGRVVQISEMLQA